MNSEPRQLFTKDFILLWLGQSVSKIGNAAGSIALMWWVYQTFGSALALGTLAMVQGITMTVLSPIGGVVADRISRKHLIVLTDAVRGIVYCTFACLAWTGNLNLPILLVGAVINTICAAFFSPAISSAIPLIVPESELDRANSLNQMSANLTNIIGLAAGGVLVGLIGVPLLLLTDGISFIISAFSELFIAIPMMVHEHGQAFTWRTVTTDLRDGFNYLKENTVLLRIMQVAMVLNFFYVPFFILLPKFVGDYMGASSSVYGYLLCASAVGRLLATLLISLTSFVKRNLWLVKWGIVVECAFMLMLPFLPGRYWLMHAGILLITGCVNAIVNIYFFTIMQRVTRPEYMGKVFGMLNTLTGALQPVAQGITGFIGDLINLRIILATCFGISGTTGIGFAFIPGIDDFLGTRQQSTPAAAVAASDQG